MQEFSIQCKLMGSIFKLAVVTENEKRGNELLNLGIDEIKRIENLLSEFLPHSETSKINNHSWEEPLVIDKECFELIERCLHISQLSKGCFDITVSPLKKIYSFKNQQFKMPSSRLIQETLEKVGYKKIHINKEKSTLFFDHKELNISFSAIGKGYASDRVKKLWIEQGVNSGYINASGDLNAFGLKPDGTQWKIGIANPDERNKILLYVNLNHVSVATSGDYEQFFLYQGKRYSHNINPHTGLPLSGIKSVTVFSPSAELSDALATAIYVLNKNEGIKFANLLPQTHCIIIDSENKFYFSDKLEYEKNTL